MIVLEEGRIVSEGAPEDALGSATIARTFGMRARVERDVDGVVITILGASEQASAPTPL